MSTNWRTISVIAFCSSVFSWKCEVSTAMAPYLGRLGGARRIMAGCRMPSAVVEAFTAAGLTGSGAVDKAEIDRLSNAVASLAEEDFVTKMISVEGVAMSAQGVDGMREVLDRLERGIRGDALRGRGDRGRGENALMLARQVSITRVGGVTIEQPSAVVFKFRDGRIHRAEWHMDRAAAERSAQSSQE